MLTMKDIIMEGDPILRQEAEEVAFPLSDELQTISEQMLDFLKNSQDEELAKKYQLRPGVGLAAPQIGQKLQMVALHIVEPTASDDEEEEIVFSDVIYNPKIISHSVQEIALKDGEGCLSVDRPVPGLVPRARRITVRYQDAQGETHELRLRNYEAIVFQHEIDHLKGIMFYDHIDEDKPWVAKEDLALI